MGSHTAEKWRKEGTDPNTEEKEKKGASESSVTHFVEREILGRRKNRGTDRDPD